MINKTFNSDSTDGRALEVGRNGERPWLNIREFDLENTMFMLAPSDAPALCLAILEAAGGRDSLGIDVGNAMADLREYVTEQERITAEDRERADLEAEALELHNAFWGGWERNHIDSWDDQPGKAKNAWVSVARRVREMRAEK